MFISPAYAQTTGGGFGGIESFLPIILIFVVFYFLLIRPQQKKQKQHRDMLSAIRRGDRVVTGGDHEVQVEIAQGVRVKVQRALIASVLAKTQPAGSAPVAANSNQGQSGGIIKSLLGGKK
jgi:preprotein translocase subunit YajC